MSLNHKDNAVLSSAITARKVRQETQSKKIVTDWIETHPKEEPVRLTSEKIVEATLKQLSNKRQKTADRLLRKQEVDADKRLGL